MQAIRIDPAARVAWVEAGTTAGQLTATTAAHGLVVPFGDSPTVGVGARTLSYSNPGELRIRVARLAEAAGWTPESSI